MDKPLYEGTVASILPDERNWLHVLLWPSTLGGRKSFVIDLLTWSEQEDKDASMALLCPDDARALAAHLLNAAGLAEQAGADPVAGVIGVRQLPMITLCGTAFVIDERLRQLRNVENPHHFFHLDDPSGR